MNKGIRKIDEALRLGELELSCLQAGEIEKAEGYAKSRASLVREAGQFFQPGMAEEFKNKLVEMHGLQGKLTEEAKKLHSYLQEEFKQGKKQARVQRGYNKTLTSGTTAIPRYMDRTS